MKDKSRFLSSVIVSLLAGFIYYLFGQNISENVVSSVKAVLSSDHSEEYMPSDCFSFNSDIKISGNKLSGKKSSFKKNHTFQFKETIVTLPVETLSSADVKNSQAKFQKPAPDKNVDFTSELNRLIKNDRSKIEIKPGKENRINKSFGNTDNETADLNIKIYINKKLGKNNESFQMKSYNKNYKGNGFEYNYVVSGVAKEPVKKTGRNNIDNSGSDRINKKCSEYNYNYNFEKRSEEKVEKKRKVMIIAPKIQININDEEIDTDLQEINTEESSDEDLM
ncbi:MAG TPA: hypothetical protein PKC91_07385 [Ignavibacteria bacterium]|nr:hypothetical protein [Ignavibacteria bacterium]